MVKTRGEDAEGSVAQREAYGLRTERLGALPIVNHFLARLGLPALLTQGVPTRDRRCAVPYATGLLVLLRSLVVQREPIYRQQETVATFAPAAFGVTSAEAARLGDDTLGRALDRLFRADRGTLLTQIIVAAVRAFGVALTELHNDSTTVRFTGQYRAARGRVLGGRRAPWITYGHSKDHRPDLKQLLVVLTTSADGGIPVEFRCADGNTNDATTHRETWEALRKIAGRADFLYVADSKLCTAETLEYLDRYGGRFVTVLPRSRREDAEFRAWIQTHAPVWEEVWNRPHPRRRNGPRDVWRVFRYPLPSREGFPVIWVWSALLALRQQETRRERLARAVQALERLQQQLAGQRPRLRARRQVELRVEEIRRRLSVERYLQVEVLAEQEHRFRQEHRGRPGPQTRYRRHTRRRWGLRWATDERAIAADHQSDGMYPLLTNDRRLTPREVLEAHKRQPIIEKRFEQLKTVHEIAPVLLKNEGRVEALFFLYFVALLVQALIERELRTAMSQERIPELPLYPEERRCSRPSTEQVLRLFSLTQRHTLLRGERVLRVFDPELTDLQRTVLHLLGIPEASYRHRA